MRHNVACGTALAVERADALSLFPHALIRRREEDESDESFTKNIIYLCDGRRPFAGRIRPEGRQKAATKERSAAGDKPWVQEPAVQDARAAEKEETRRVRRTLASGTRRAGLRNNN